MKNIESIIKNNCQTKPKRNLRDDFTKNITKHLINNPQKPGFRQNMETQFMKFFAKPALAIATIATVTAISGAAAYAAIGGWPVISAAFGGQNNLKNGDRIVKVETKNCSTASSFNATSDQKSQDNLYYKIRQGSTLSNEQVIKIVQDSCYSQAQANFDDKTIMDVLNSNPLNKNRIASGVADSVVTAVSSSAISLESKELNINGDVKIVKQTFNNIADDVLAYSSPDKIKFADIKVGDHVSIKYRASDDALKNSETSSPLDVNTNEQTIIAVVKNTRDLNSTLDLQKYNGTEFEQVVPCDNGDNGFCSAAQYQQNK